MLLVLAEAVVDVEVEGVVDVDVVLVDAVVDVDDVVDDAGVELVAVALDGLDFGTCGLSAGMQVPLPYSQPLSHELLGLTPV